MRFNIDADLTRFSQLVKKIQEVRKEMEKLSKFSVPLKASYECGVNSPSIFQSVRSVHDCMGAGAENKRKTSVKG